MQLQAESDASQLALAQLQGHLAEREAELSVLQGGQEDMQNALQQSKAAVQKVRVRMPKALNVAQRCNHSCSKEGLDFGKPNAVLTYTVSLARN